MDFFAHCYTKSDLDKVIELAVEQVAPNLGEPDKIVRVYYDTQEPVDENAVDTYYNLTNQTRFYLKMQKVVFITEGMIYTIPFSKIADYDIVLPNENNKKIYSTSTMITRTDTGDVIKRAIIGGVLAGGIGAVIGGVTAKHVSDTNKFDEYFQSLVNQPLLELHLKFDDILAPLIRINFDTGKNEIQEIAASLDVIVKNNADSYKKNEVVERKILIESYDLESVGRELGILPTNPFTKYEQTADGWNADAIFGLIIIIAILFGLFYMCS